MRSDQPVAQAGAKQAGAATAVKFELNTVFIALRCWWKIAFPLGVLLAATASSIVYYLFEPTYTASAWVFIGERAREIMPTPADDSRNFVANQIELMRSPYLLTPIATRPEVRSTPELAKARDPFVALADRLEINNQGKSEYYSIEFSSKSPQKAALIVNSICEEYIKLQRFNTADQRSKIVEVLDQFRSKLEQQVSEADGNVQTLAKQMKVELKNALVDSQRPTQSAEDAALASIQSELIKFEVDFAMLEAICKSLEQSLAGANFEVSDVDLDIALESDPYLTKLKDDLDTGKRNIEGRIRTGTPVLLAKDPKHQLLLADQKKLEEQLKAETERRRAEIKQRFAAALENQRRADLEAKKAELLGITQTRDELRRKLAEAGDKQQAAQGEKWKLSLAIQAHERAEEFHATVIKQLDSIKANGQIEGDRVYSLQRAETPTNPDEQIPFKLIGMVAAASLCGPFLLAVGWEHFFRRVNSREQLESAGDLKVVGEITALPRRKRRSANTATSRELQLFEESVDGLRTYLSLVDALQGFRVLCVTSAISREGKTSVAAQLAVSIAGATGEPTLLIDGDLRSPDIHRVFGVDLAPGLAEVLSGELTDDEAIETDFNETLHLMTAGKLDTSPHRLLGSGEFKALLERLRGVYRYILIDTPPLLAASEALILARAADAAILAARRDYSRLDQVTEAYSRLCSAGVSFAGIVLNGIPIRHYAYKYGTYGYRGRVATAT